MAVSASPILSRASFDTVYKKYKKIGKGKVRLTQSSLILIQDISPTKDSYLFKILESDNRPVPKPEEIRLDINDEFISYRVGYYLSADVTDVEAVLVAKKWFTYAPVEIDADMWGLEDGWFGNLSIDVNKINRVTNWDLRQHLYVPRTQVEVSAVAKPVATQPNQELKEDGMITMQPMVTFSGAKKNLITIDLVRAIPNTAAFTFTAPDAVDRVVTFKELVLVFRGMLGQNASKFQ